MLILLSRSSLVLQGRLSHDETIVVRAHHPIDLMIEALEVPWPQRETSLLRGLASQYYNSRVHCVYGYVMRAHMHTLVSRCTVHSNGTPRQCYMYVYILGKYSTINN